VLDFFSPAAITGFISLGLWLVLLVAKGLALFDTLRYNAQSFVAAGKQTRQLWLIINGLSFVVHLITQPLNFLNVAGTIACIVFLVDVRPALRQVSGRGGSGGGSQMGPYGPW
jgi:hypothetical protein